VKPWIWVAVLLPVTALVIRLIAEIPFEDLDFVALEMWLQGFGIWAYLLFAVAFVVLALLPVPSTFWVLLGGGLFGPWLGTVVSLVSATLSAVLAFGIGRHLARVTTCAPAPDP